MAGGRKVEREIKLVAVGRKNWLFCASQRGARAAVLYTLVASAARHNLDLWAYLRDVLARLALLALPAGDSPADDDQLASLLPDVWAATHPDSVREYRQHERESRAAAKRLRRQRRRLLGPLRLPRPADGSAGRLRTLWLTLRPEEFASVSA